MSTFMRYFSFILCLLLCVFLASACGEDNNSNESSSSEESGGQDSSGAPVGSVFTENMSLPQTVRDYYRNAYGKSGAELKATLQTIITTGHQAKGYAALWTMYGTSDLVPTGVANAGKIWDMYSNTSENGSAAAYWYTYSTSQCGNYSGENACYNREHTWPINTFGGNTGSVPGNDGHHITPTDGYVNGRRSNNAYGEVTSPTWTSQNGGKLGPARANLGFSGTVFEVINIYKGDHARMHFYMAVRYYNNANPAFAACDWANAGAKLKPWYAAMLKTWHTSDPLSQKEIDRNNAIHQHQGNRNPFIDYPELVDMIDFEN